MKEYEKPDLISLAEGYEPLCGNGSGASTSGCADGLSPSGCSAGETIVGGHCTDGGTPHFGTSSCMIGSNPGNSYTRCVTGTGPA